MEMPSQEYFQAGCRESSAKLAPRLFVVSFGSQFTEFTLRRVPDKQSGTRNRMPISLEIEELMGSDVSAAVRRIQ